MPKVSVIVPVYNAEKYLSDCISSILRQTITDLELILVDDGSTDSSPSICDAFEIEDKRVKVIHKANGRAASARNAGLKIAEGEYVAFADADDWISPEMYEKMLAASADVVLCDYERFCGEDKFPFSQINVEAGFYDKKQMIEKIYPHTVMDGIEFPISISNWVMLIKKDVIDKNQLRYREDILISEDAPFGSEVLYCANSFAYLKGEYLYHYRITEGSASKSYKSWWWDSYLKISEETEDFFSKVTDFDFREQIQSNMFYLARAEIYYILNDKALTKKEQNQKIKEVMNHPRVERLLKDYWPTKEPIQFKMLLLSIQWKSVKFRRLIGVMSRLKAKIGRTQ